MHIFCDSLDDISSLSAILSDSYILGISMTSSSSIRILINRSRKECEYDNSERKQLCYVDINNVHSPQNYNNFCGKLLHIKHHHLNNQIKISLVCEEFDCKVRKCTIANLDVLVNNISIVIQELDRHITY